MAFELPSAVYSPELLESVIYDLEHYLDWYRQAKVQKQVGAPAAEEPTYSAETVLTLQAWTNGQKPTLDTLEALLEHLRGLNLPVVHLTLAALPNHEQRARLIDWFRTNATSRLLLSVVADRNLGGGVVVRTPNRIFDYSWKQKLVEGRSKIAEIIQR